MLPRLSSAAFPLRAGVAGASGALTITAGATAREEIGERWRIVAGAALGVPPWAETLARILHPVVELGASMYNSGGKG
jgi:hypothetical protein